MRNYNTSKQYDLAIWKNEQTLFWAAQGGNTPRSRLASGITWVLLWYYLAITLYYYL